MQASQIVFYHLKFSDVEDTAQRNKLYEIKTSFNIEAEGIAAIDFAVDKLMTSENSCLLAIKQLLETGVHSEESICSYRH
jgi:heme-binding NEAT domain protein